MKKIIIFLILIHSITFAQTYTVDNTFNPSDTGVYSQYVGEFGTLLNDGKILTTEGYGLGYSDIYRLNNDGSIDNSFSKLKIPYPIDDLFANPISGNFITVIGNLYSDSTTIKSYDANGVPVLYFTSPIFTKNQTQGYNGAGINKIYFLNDGKFLIFGDFKFVNGVSYNSIVRLNADGSVDTGFTTGTGFNAPTTAFAIQSDGKYLIGGNFSSFNGVTRTRIARLNPNGTLDSSFNVERITNPSAILKGYDNYGYMNDIIVQPNGKIVTSGCDYLSYDRRYRNIVRLNSDGSIDTTFYLNYYSNYYSRNIYYDNLDGGIFFKDYTSIKKCNNSGTIISTFKDTNVQGDANFTSEGTIRLQNNKLLVVGSYKNTAGITRLGYHRLNSDGTIDLTFNPSFGPNIKYFGNLTNTSVSGISGCTLLPDNKIFLTGGFTTYNDVPVKGLIMLTENGEIDSSFNKNLAQSYDDNFSGSSFVRTKKNYDGKLYVKGKFSLDGTGNYKTIIKLNYDGSIDTSFNFRDEANDFVVTDKNEIITMNYGKITKYDSNGVVDNSFIAPNYVYPTSSLELLDNNQILVSLGDHSFYNRYLNKLNENGTLDTTFQKYVGYNGVFNTKTLNNGKAYILEENSSNKRQLTRYNADWTFDQSFTPIPTYRYAFLSNERILTEGSMSTYRINDSSGKQLSTFSLTTDQPTYSQGFYSQNCENIIFYGTFNKVNGINKNNIVRLKVQGSTTTSAPVGAITQSFSQGQMLSDLIINGQNIKWYDFQSQCASNALNGKTKQGDTSLPDTTLLIHGTTYYASQTINGFESNFRLPVTVSLTSLGINKLELKNLKLYPNPIKDKLTISNSSNIEKVEIYNLLGQKIFENNFNINEINIDFTNNNQNIYLIKIFSEGKVQTSKITND